MTTSAKPGAELSARERQVLQAAANLPTAHEVAEELGIELSTVYTYYRDAAIKLGVRGGIRKTLAHAAQIGLIEAPATPPTRTIAKRGPYAGTLRARIAEFYAERPDEWLSWDDLCAKFDCTKDQAKAALEALRATGRLRWKVIGVILVEREGEAA